MYPQPINTEALFSGVSTRIFPLRADPATLQAFIDQYLNRHELNGRHYFRSQNSYVMMSVLNYKQLGDPISRFGYITQNELLFSIPLQWYTLDPNGGTFINGKLYSLLKHEDTSTAPFVFVDDDRSALGGRELFGWPKLRMNLKSTPDAWLTNPENTEQVLGIETYLFRELFRHNRREPIDLIEINRRPNASLVNTPGGSARQLRSLVQNSLDWQRVIEHKQSHESFWTKQAQQQIASLPPEQATQLAQIGLAEQNGFELAQNRPLLGRTRNNIGLKQTMHADLPSISAYQALGNSISVVEHVRDQGMLARMGSEADASGGYEVCIKELEQLPIAKRLGLISDRTKGSWETFLPVAPSWLDIDISYRPAPYTALFEAVHGRMVPPADGELPEFQSEYRRNRNDFRSNTEPKSGEEIEVLLV